MEKRKEMEETALTLWRSNNVQEAIRNKKLRAEIRLALTLALGQRAL